MNKRLLLYVHFNRNNELSEHIIYQLEHLRPIFGEVFFISNSQLSSADQSLLTDKRLIDHFLQRENKGYDFVAWSDAMKQYGFDKLAEYDSVTIMNDTCFGPVFDLEAPFVKFEQDKKVDFWGITNNRSHRITKPWDGKEFIIPDHIQSYFVSYKQNVVKSEAFRAFWDNVEVLDDVVKVILQYETAMTKHFESAGFKAGVMFDTRKEDWAGMMVHDFSVFNLSSLVERRIPFLKVKAFSFGAEAVYTPVIFDELKRLSDYPLHYIVDHMTWADYPDRPYMLDEKVIKIDELASAPISETVGIHLHVFYVELLQEFLDNFDQYIGNYELYITTDTREKEKQIQEITAKRENVKEIIVTGNIGRDIIPWMTIHEKLSKYKVAGHFHTKKSADNYWVVGESWRQDLVENLIKPAQKLLPDFMNNEKVGVLISDVPNFFNDFHGPIYIAEEAIWNEMQSVWNRINFAKRVELKQKDSYVMSYGTMLWYKPQALDNLLAVDIKSEVPEEPLPYDSILHAFERLVVYTAWGNGFDFRISKIRSVNGFMANVSLNRTLREVTGDKRDYRARELAVMCYRKIKFMIKHNFLKLIGRR